MSGPSHVIGVASGWAFSWSPHAGMPAVEAFRAGQAFTLQLLAWSDSDLARMTAEVYVENQRTARAAQAQLDRDPSSLPAQMELATDRRMRRIAVEHQQRARVRYREARAAMGIPRDFFTADGRCMA